MNSMTYAKDSKSYLIQITQTSIKNGDLAFFVEYFLPNINALDKYIKANKKQPGTEIRSKKYETLMVQLWELLPEFCKYNSP